MADFRTTLRGKLPGDVWQFGFVLSSDEGIQGVADAVAAQMQAYLSTTIKAQYPGSVSFDSVYVSELATGTGTVLNTAEAAIGIAGTSAQAALPPQVSLCVSVLPVNGTSRGRFYLPPMVTGQLATSGRVSATTTQQQADAWQGFFSALGQLSAPCRLGIWRTSSQSFAAARGISIGDVLDTQRRRRNKLIEARVERNVL